MSARTRNQEDYNRLTVSVRKLNGNAGGIESASSMTRVGPAQIGFYQNLNDDRHAPIDVIADLEYITGTPEVTQALCALAGGYFTPIIKSDDHPIFAAHLARIGKETSEVMGEAAKALCDGTISDEERKILITELDEAISAIAAAKACLNYKNPKCNPILEAKSSIAVLNAFFDHEEQ